MLKLYTGKPGSFKTAKAVSDSMRYLKEGRQVYTNIADFDYEGVQKLPESLDWGDCPHGSVVIYDEAQQFEFLQYKGREKLSTDQRVKELETHRHQGYDIILITQSPSFLHNHVLSLVGEHYHLHRAYGRSYADVFLWRYTVHSPDSSVAKSKAESHEKFKPDSKIFDNYKSTEIDTHKLRVPPIYWKLAGFLVAVVALIGYMVFGSSNPFLSAHKIKDNYDSASGTKVVESQASSVTIDDKNNRVQGLDERTQKQRRQDFESEIQRIKYNVNQPYDIDYSSLNYEIKQVPYFAGCIKVDGRYYGYSQQGTRLDVSQADCKKYMGGERPFNPFLDSGQGSNVQNTGSGSPGVYGQSSDNTVNYQRTYEKQEGELAHGFG